MYQKIQLHDCKITNLLFSKKWMIQPFHQHLHLLSIFGTKIRVFWDYLPIYLVCKTIVFPGKHSYYTREVESQMNPKTYDFWPNRT